MGLDQVKVAIAAALERAGLRAVTAFGPKRLEAYGGPVVTVGVRRGECRQAGLWDYLGEREEKGARREIYGRRLDITLSLDAWADAETGAERCQQALERAYEAVLNGLPAGIRPGEMVWEEVKWDRETGMFLRRGTLQCGVYLLAAAREETGELTDFVLKGVLTDERHYS